MRAGVAEWQTRRLQVPVAAMSCGFKSHPLHKGKIEAYASIFYFFTFQHFCNTFCVIKIMS